MIKRFLLKRQDFDYFINDNHFRDKIIVFDVTIITSFYCYLNAVIVTQNTKDYKKELEQNIREYIKWN